MDGHVLSSKVHGFSHEEIIELRKNIANHLKETDAFSKVRGVVEEYLRNHKDATQEEALKEIQQRGLLDQILGNFPAGASSGGLRAPLGGSASALEGGGGGGGRVGVDPSRRHLHVRISQGRAFTQHLQLGAAPDGERLALSLQVLGTRHVSRPVRSCAEPPFDEIMLVDLQQALRANPNGPPASLREILRLSEELQVSCIRISPEGQSQVVGRGSVEWRHCLCREGRAPCVIELMGQGPDSSSVMGVLDLSMSLLPNPEPLELLPASLLRDQARLARGLRAEALNRFISAAKSWWRDFQALCPQHRTRLVKVLARGEDGEQQPVCKFVRPLSAGRLLGTSREAARMVSLLGIQEESPIGGTPQEAWSNTHTLLVRGCGAKEEHALLLCALLSGFGLDAYVCIGKDGRGGGAAWVVTRHSGHVTLWDPQTALRYGASEDMLPLGRCPYRYVGCVFNHKVICANLQADDSLASTSFSLEDSGKWHVLRSAETELDVIDPALPAPLRPPQLNTPQIEEAIEAQLRRILKAQRRQLAPAVTSADEDASCGMWDDGLSRLLMPALVAYESEIVTGIAPGNEEFQQAIKRAVPQGHTFKGYPRHFNHQSAALMAQTLMREKVPHEILSTVGTSVCFGLRVKVFPFPEDLTSVWLMLAVKYRGIDGALLE